MAKMTYRPWKEVVIHEILEYNVQELCSNKVRQVLQSGAAGITPSLGWAEGLIFSYVPFPDTDDVVREKLNGIIHYSVVEYALLPEYRAEIQVTIAGSQYSVRLQKVQENPVFIDLARFLKERNQIS